jgi:hypothetical protein
MSSSKEGRRLICVDEPVYISLLKLKNAIIMTSNESEFGLAEYEWIRDCCIYELL